MSEKFLLFIFTLVCIVKVIFASIVFTPPTPPNNSYYANTSVIINLSIEEANLSDFKFIWNGDEKYNQREINESWANLTGLVLLLHMNEGSGNVIYDASGLGNDGTIYGATWTDGKFGKALEFDGVNDYVDCGNDESLDITDEVTIEAWAKRFSATGSYSFVVSKDPAYRLEMHDYVTFWIKGRDGNWYEWNSKTLPNDNTWYHIVGTYDSSTQEWKIYINGELDASGTQSTGGIATTTNPLIIGGNYYVGVYDHFFNGTIDEVAIYNRSLSAEEIKEHAWGIRNINATAWIFTINITNFTDGTYTYYAWINDTEGNEKQSEIRSLIIDLTPPTIIPYSFNSVLAGSIVTFKCNVSDEINVKNATLRIWKNNKKIHKETKTVNSKSSTLVWDIVIENTGNYTWNCEANDEVKHSASSKNQSFLALGIIHNLSSLLSIYDENETKDLTINGSMGVVKGVLKKGMRKIALMDINFSRSFDWSDVIADVGNYSMYAKTYGKSFIHYNKTKHNEISNVRLFIPAIQNTGLIYVCPNATTLNEINESCPGRYYVYVESVDGYYNISVQGTGAAESSLSKLIIFDETDVEGGNKTKVQGQPIKFFANYTNITSGEVISDATCVITFNLSNGWTSPENMSYNASSKLYEYVRSFSSSGIFIYNISCNGTTVGFDILTLQDNVTVTNDTIAPSINFVEPTEISDTYLARNYIRINVTASDVALANITIFLYNETSLVNSSVLFSSGFIKFTDLKDGVYFFNATALDFAGNTNSTETRKVTIDTTAPSIMYVPPTEENNSAFSRNWIAINVSVIEQNEANITFYLYNASDDIVNKIISTDKLRFINFTNLSDGVYKFKVEIYDKVGHVNTTPLRVQILDTTPPKIISTSPKNDTNVTSSQITLIVKTNENATCKYSNETLEFENMAYFNITGGMLHSVDMKVSDNTTYQFYIRCNDSVGNINPTYLLVFHVDFNVPPNATKLLSPTNASYLNYTPTFSWLKAYDQDNDPLTYELLVSNQSDFSNVVVNISTPNLSYTPPGLSDGTYFWKVRVRDIVGNYSDWSDTWQLVLDTTPPIVKKFKQNVKLGENVTLKLNISDISPLSVIRAKITCPNQSNVIKYMLYNATTKLYVLQLSNLSVGDYDVEYFVNDSAGNVNITRDWFEVYIPLNFSGEFKDAEGNLVNVTVKFYRPNSSIMLFNFTSSIYNFTKGEIHKRLYDIEINVYNHTLKLYSVNLTENTVALDFDNVPTSVFSLANYKALTILAVNSSIHTKIKFNLSYESLYSSEFSAISENELTVHRCANWIYVTRMCNGTWELVTGTDVDTLNDRITFITEGFSAYAITENTCGNKICQPAYGENENTCPSDCAVIETTSGGGGGGIGRMETTSSTTTTTIPQTFEVSINRIARKLVVGQVASETVTILNRKPETIKVKLVLEGEIINHIILPEREIELKPGESKDVYLTLIAGTNEAIVYGNLKIIMEKTQMVIPITLEIVKPPEKLLDVSVETASKQLTPGESLKVKIIMYNMGTSERYDVVLHYTIMNFETKEVVWKSTETVAIQTSLSFIREFLIPKTAKEGYYVLYINATYDSTSTLAAAFFHVKPSLLSSLPKPLQEKLHIIIGTLLILGIVIAVTFACLHYRKKKVEKEMEEKKKKSIYVWPEFNLLPPKTKSVWLGLIADTNVKAYLEYDQLNMHTLIAGGTGSGKTVSGMVIVEELLQKGIPVIVFDPVGQWTGFARPCKDAKMLALYPKFKIPKKRARGFRTTIIEIEDPEADLDIKRYMKKGLTVFLLNKLTPSKLDKFISRVLDEIYRMNLPETNRLKLLIALDEVHRLLPKYGGKKAYIKLEQAVREFRKWGIGLLMISQVLTDFKGAIRGNIATEIQMRTKYDGDVKRVYTKYGSKFSRVISKLPTGVGMVQNPAYNKGNPYFVEFRPLLHSPFKLPESALKRIAKRLKKTKKKR